MYRISCYSVTLVLVLPACLLAQPKTQSQPRIPFGQMFKLPGIELTQSQRTKLNQLREQYGPKLNEFQRKNASILTREQQLARRDAFKAAREAGKRGAELQKVVNKALRLTKEQKEQIEANRKARIQLVDEIQAEVLKLLTPEQRKQLQRRNPARGGRQALRPTHANVKYGPHERNVMDVWLAKSDKPTPVLVSIHGGGFRGGNKGVQGELLKQCLDSGISVVAITYRLSKHAIAPAQFLDAARAIQFVRSKADTWKLDPKRIASTGGSAGAGLSLWLGFHDDLAQPKSDDVVRRQSSRLTCMVVYNGQTSYDPRFIRKLFPNSDIYKHSALAQLYDVDLNKLDSLPKEKYQLFEKVSPLHHLGKGDAPAMLIYGSKMTTPITSQGIGIHHPRFGKVLKVQMDKLGIECRVETGVRRGDARWTSLTMGFVKKHFGMKK